MFVANIYKMAVRIPSVLKRFIVSKEKDEKVVNPPNSPTTKNSFKL